MRRVRDFVTIRAHHGKGFKSHLGITTTVGCMLRPVNYLNGTALLFAAVNCPGVVLDGRYQPSHMTAWGATIPMPRTLIDHRRLEVTQ
jgi:hypothetical protein